MSYSFLASAIDDRYHTLQGDLQFIDFPEMHDQILADLLDVVRAAHPTAEDKRELEDYDKVALFNVLMQKPLHCLQQIERFAKEYPESPFATAAREQNRALQQLTGTSDGYASSTPDLTQNIVEAKRLTLETALEVVYALSKGKQKPARPHVTLDMINQFFGKQIGVSDNSLAQKLIRFTQNHPNLEMLKEGCQSAAFAEVIRKIHTLARSAEKGAIAAQ